jgi:16S rRNA (guanine527-N7)-methyltransferase
MVNETLAGKLSAGMVELFPDPADPARIAQLLSFIELLERWNQTYNLTAIRDPEQMITRHLLDSLSVMPWIDHGPVLDAGTGAGLPGIPLAIMRPDLHITLLDSSGKKVRFLRQAARQLELVNIHPVQARLESWICGEFPRVIISRAFSELAVFVRAVRHLADEETTLLAMKGKYPESELEALPDGLQVRKIEKLKVPGLQEERHLVIMSFIK